MTAEQQAKAFWYNRMMNVTARGFKPQAAGGYVGTHVRWPNAEWVFAADCPQDIKDLFALRHPVPAYYSDSYDPKTGKVCWGYVSVWEDHQLGTGWENKVFWDYPDTTVIRFLFEKYVDGKPTKQVCHVTAKKAE